MSIRRTLAVIALPVVMALAACARQDGSEPAAAAATAPAGPTRGIVQAADGVSIVYETVGEGDTAVLFVHCWGCNREFWAPQIEAVRTAGYRVVTLDLPGHGESGANRAEWSVVALASDVQAVADALGLERIILVGHSMGGPVSLAVAARNPGRVRGIACVDTLHNAEFEWPEGMTAKLSAGLEADYRAGIEAFVPQLLPADADPGLARWIVEQAVASDHAATIALMRDFGKLDMPALFSAAGVPIRCINAAPAGEQSMATATEINRRYADFGAVEMQGVGHYPQLERPQDFNRQLLAVLRELAAR